MRKRHNFNQNTKETLAKRVGFRCSNPNCRKLTSGPATENDESAEKKAEQELDSSITEQYFYKGIFFQSKLHACWAVFFDKIKWHYSYEINEPDSLKHNFKIRTNNGDELFTYIMSRASFNLKKRQRLGVKTDYAKNILILFESPFPFDEFGYCKNLIGMSSVENKIKNGFCLELWKESKLTIGI
ncbi:hypothetical protein [Tenacibaculum piscium]|uniref:hypothetical protein n=1 Tax=Tenacibaculum piscium TaxID=1458515 RepID=UPI00187B4A4A|nr:hypothetical protein [Tenacibaculum piscium]MBE7690187.1 hypothetical protein [Tenacibaculum piscium]